MAPPQSPRARYREQTRAEIKDAALRQLAEGGTAGLALARIAKEMGLSGPALYRYFASRDDLLSALIRDAYDDAADCIARAAEASCDAGPRERLHALANGYRAWAVAEPHRYLLIEGTPVPGYTAPPDTVESARAVLGPFLAAFRTAEPSGAVQPVVRQMAVWADKDAAVGDWVAQYADTGSGASAGTALAGAVLAWSHMHGAVSLEVSGQFSGMGHTGATLLTAQINTLADAFRLA